jgi:protease-4
LIGNLGASGGYYISAGASKIVAHPASITGSIGVIMQVRNIDGLYEKLGIETRTFKSADFKDNSPLWQGGQKQQELENVYQSLVDESYDRFVTIVAEGREMDVETVRELADGRIYTGKQALDNGLVDQNGFLADALVSAADLAELDDPSAVYYEKDNDIWTDLGLSVSSALSSTGLMGIVPKSFTAPGVYTYYMLEPLGSN